VKPTQATEQATERDLADLLVRNGVQVTRQRLEVLRELAVEPNDATAQMLWTRLREQRGSTIGLATVYRTLSLLSERGVVDPLAHREGELCYRLCGESHHHHLVCSNCHRVVEVDEHGLADWLNRVFAKHDFVAKAHTVELTGLCSACRK
jgi:Fur family ferric uptake transcriptional regulator